MTRAYVALGSNLDDPSQQVRQALKALASMTDTRLLQHSHLYLTPPWGITEQPSFVNAVAELDTALAPLALLDALLEIEQRAGRVRTERNGPRTLDLDLLHIDGARVDDARLTLPHPRMADRAFVLLPLCDVAPDLPLPGNITVAQRLQQLDMAGIERLP